MLLLVDLWTRAMSRRSSLHPERRLLISFFLGGGGGLPPILRLLYLVFKNDRYLKIPSVLRLLFFVSNAIFRL